MVYHPDLVETLYESYRHFPDAVSVGMTNLVLFDGKGQVCIPNDWIYDFRQLVHEPSLQLMPIGVGGLSISA